MHAGRIESTFIYTACSGSRVGFKMRNAGGRSEVDLSYPNMLVERVSVEGQCVLGLGLNCIVCVAGAAGLIGRGVAGRTCRWDCAGGLCEGKGGGV